MFNEKLQAGLLSLGNLIALHAVNVFRSTPSGSRRVRRILKKFGTPFSAHGLGSSGGPKVFKWTKVASGSMKLGRIFVHSEELSSDIRGRECTPGSLGVAVALRVEFTIA